MFSLRDKGDGTYVVTAFGNIDSAVAEGIEIARTTGNSVAFDFNDVIITVDADSIHELILRDYWRAQEDCIEKMIGPRSTIQLSEAELASDARIRSENQARWEAASAASRARARAQRARVKDRMTDAPTIELSNEELWLAIKTEERDDNRISTYAERWARMMQLELSEGKTLEQIWHWTSREADLEGMSGATSSIAVDILARCWIHGAQLRRLHNTMWGSDSTEETVNAAVIVIGDMNEEG